MLTNGAAFATHYLGPRRLWRLKEAESLLHFLSYRLAAACPKHEANQRCCALDLWPRGAVAGFTFADISGAP